MNILVGYSSRSGSTRGIAEHIAARLRDRGIQAIDESMPAVSKIGGYDALILGSAIHNGDWLPEGVEFLRTNLDVLAAKPVWLFSVSTVGRQSSAFGPLVAGWFRKMRRRPRELAKVLPALHPRSHHDFAGAIKRGDWSRAGDLFLRLFGGHLGDFRNWQEIDAWTDSIKKELEALTAAAPS